MPVEIDGKTFESHDAAVKHLKKSKPSISNPDAYVATVERKMRGAQLKARLQKLGASSQVCSDCGLSLPSKAALDRHYKNNHDKLEE